jgi:hypothetical protein
VVMIKAKVNALRLYIEFCQLKSYKGPLTLSMPPAKKDFQAEHSVHGMY